MVVRIRLSRWGRRNRPFYRIFVADSRAPRDGRHLEVVGRYNPLYHSREETKTRVKRVELNVGRIKYWLSVGAQCSETVERLLGSAGVLPVFWRSVSSRGGKDVGVRRDEKVGGEWEVPKGDFVPESMIIRDKMSVGMKDVEELSDGRRDGMGKEKENHRLKSKVFNETRSTGLNVDEEMDCDQGLIYRVC